MNQHINTSAYDTYAAAALQALIAKLPMLDRQGEFGEIRTDEDIQVVKKQIAGSAHEYAMYMMELRGDYIEASKVLIKKAKLENPKD